MNVLVIGAGKVGQGFTRALRRTRHGVTVRAARRGVPREPIAAGLVILAVRDPDLPEWAARLAASGVLGKRSCVVHAAGAIGPEVLAPLREATAGVGQAHPVVSFPSLRVTPELRGAGLFVAGDPVAVRRASTVGRAMGLVPVLGDGVDPLKYHLGCAIAANGAAALADVAVRFLGEAGLDHAAAERLIGPLIATVGSNVRTIGVPEALSGPVRRGDAAAVRRHLARVHADAPELEPLYRELLRVKLHMARRVGEATPEGLAAVAALLARRSR